MLQEGAAGKLLALHVIAFASSCCGCMLTTQLHANLLPRPDPGACQALLLLLALLLPLLLLTSTCRQGSSACSPHVL